ncbi:MAG: hypothetical protein WBL93_08770 [Lutisporaceae bacterium]
MALDIIYKILDLLYNILYKTYEKFVNFSGEQIAFLSIIVTLILYILGKRSELNLKKHESKKQQYIKLITLLEKVFSENLPKDKSGNFKLTPEIRKDFFDLGSSLLLYGSKKLYKQYIFYRELATNPIIERSKYYDDGILMYVIADMLTTIRKEVGLNKLDSITSVESLAFFVNNVANNPFSKIKSYNAHYKIKMIKLELLIIDIVELVSIHYIFNTLVKPIWGTLELIGKYVFLLTLGKIIIKLFPNFKNKVLASYIEANKKNTEIDKNV